MDFKYNGIILSKKDVGETDRVYTIYTKEDGKIKALGKGTRRPTAKLAGNLEPVTFSEIFIAKTRGIGKITGALAAENFSKIKSDLESLSQVSFAFKIIEKLISDPEKDEMVFNLILKYLSVMENLSGTEVNSPAKSAGQVKKEMLTLGFLFKLLGESGYQLEVGKCANCGEKLKPENNYFSSSLGGILCEKCAGKESDKIKIKNESIKFIRIFLKNRLENLTKMHSSKENLKDLGMILENFLISQL